MYDDAIAESAAQDAAAAVVKSSPRPQDSDLSMSRPHSRVATPFPEGLHLHAEIGEETARICTKLAEQMCAQRFYGCATVLTKLADRVTRTSNTLEDVEGTNLAVEAVCGMMSVRGLVPEAQMLKKVWDEATGVAAATEESAATAQLKKRTFQQHPQRRASQLITGLNANRYTTPPYIR